MHKCSNQLKERCLSVKITQIRDPVVARIENVGEHIQCECFLVDESIKVVVIDKTDPITAKVTDTAEHLQVCCSLVCGINTTDKYLNVAPTVVWLTPDMLSGEFNIYSNVEWVINE